MARTRRQLGQVRRPTVGWTTLGAVTRIRRGDRMVELICGAARVRINGAGEGVVRVRLAPDGEFGRDHSWAVLPAAPTGATWRMEDAGDAVRLVLPEIRVCIQRAPCRISFQTPDGLAFAEDDPRKGMAWDGRDFRCWKRLCLGDQFFGFGERAGPMNKRGQTLVNWNVDAADHEPWTDPLYQAHPFFYVLRDGTAHGIFLDNPARASFDLGHSSHAHYSFGADAGTLDYYVIVGPAPRDVLRRYARLVGEAPLPPRWSLGFQQCRWSYESARRVRRIAERLRRHRVPCDALYLDIDYMEGFRSFTWNQKSFPDPPGLLSYLRRRGFRTVVIIDPGIKHEAKRPYPVHDAGMRGGHFCNDATGRPYVGRVWPGDCVYPDFTRAATRAWWADLHAGLLRAGVAGIWTDMNEPTDFSNPSGTVPLSVRHAGDGAPTHHGAVHNIYGMQMARATFEGLSRHRCGERPFVLTRAGYSGVQRYAAVWTGDNASSWEHLRMSIPMLLNMSVSGMNFIGADIGGFRGTAAPELFSRWLQLGVFNPLFRVHTCGTRGNTAPEQDPTAYGKTQLAINRRAIMFRYQLLPYIYTAMRETERTGEPLLRPVWFDEPSAAHATKFEHEFFFGRALFAAPVIHPGATRRDFMTPPGRWHDFYTGAPCAGGARIEYPVKPDTIPLLARAGAIVPMRQAAQFTDERPLTELILNVYPGRGVGTFYNDDGLSYAYREGDYVAEMYASVPTSHGVSLRIIRREGAGAYAPPRYLVRFLGLPYCVRRVTCNGRALVKRGSAGALSRSHSGWRQDMKTKTLQVRTDGFGPGAPIVVERAIRASRNP